VTAGLEALLVELNWENVSRFVIERGGDYVEDPDFGDPHNWGEQFVLGALLINEPVTDIPEPGVLALIGIGLVGFGISRRRKAF